MIEAPNKLCIKFQGRLWISVGRRHVYSALSHSEIPGMNQRAIENAVATIDRFTKMHTNNETSCIMNKCYKMMDVPEPSAEVHCLRIVSLAGDPYPL